MYLEPSFGGEPQSLLTVWQRHCLQRGVVAGLWQGRGRVRAGSEDGVRGVAGRKGAAAVEVT